MGILEGKKGVIFGLANDRSIAHGIAKAVIDHGGELALTYQNEALAKRVRPLAESLGSSVVVPCDITDDAQVDAAFEQIGSAFGQLDFLVHSVAFANKEALKGRYLGVTRADFLQALEISAYSLTHLTRAALPLMEGRPGSILTLSYLGAERAIPNYNVMGVAKAALEASVRYLAADLGTQAIRVNAISAGPIKTLSAAGIPGFSQMLDIYETRAPMRRNVTTDEVGRSAVYLLSDLASGVTGEVHHVDAGYHGQGF
ncbi:MAG: enoyl-ACP reductase [Planctomycetota bacterium]